MVCNGIETTKNLKEKFDQNRILTRNFQFTDLFNQESYNQDSRSTADDHIFRQWNNKRQIPIKVYLDSVLRKGVVNMFLETIFVVLDELQGRLIRSLTYQQLKFVSYPMNDALSAGFVVPQSSFRIHGSTPAKDRTLQPLMPKIA